MEELYLVAYTYEANVVSHERGMKSISFGKDFKHLRRVLDIVHRIEEQTGDRAVQVMAVTALHKLIDYAGENQTDSVSAVTPSH
jgi:hypothetical protein